MIRLERVFASGARRLGATLAGVTFEHGAGVLAILGAPKDGTSLLVDVLDGTARPTGGLVTVFGTTPERARPRVTRVSLEAPLPEGLRVSEVCDLGAKLRSEPPMPAAARLERLGIAALGERRVRTLSIEERRSVALALALSYSGHELLLIEEPLSALESASPRLVIDALRERAKTAVIVVTTGSARDALSLGDSLGALASGALTMLPTPVEHLTASLELRAETTMHVVVSASSGRSGAFALVTALGAEPAVMRVETAAYAAGPGAAYGVRCVGEQPLALARAVTRAIAAAHVEVDLVEPSAPMLGESLRAALSARAVQHA